MENIAVSPCSNPEMTPAQALAAYGRLGYQQFEAFTGWGASLRTNQLDIDRQPQVYLEMARRHNMRFTSVQLPAVTDDVEASLPHTIRGARFAAALGAPIVILKARTLDALIEAAGPFLAAIAGLPLTPVITNHAGTGAPIQTLADYERAIKGINDARMRTLLEVGQFHSVGVHWRDGYALLGDSIALVHIKDQIGAVSVPFGTGEVDLPGLFRHMHHVGYRGNFVVEMEVQDRENILTYLQDALAYLRTHCLEAVV